MKFSLQRICGLDPWAALAALGAVLLLAPLFAVFVGIFEPTSEWEHVASSVLPGYLLNTLILVVGVSLVSICFAVPTAWFVATYEFQGRKFWQWALVMPLAVPTFASAFTYFDILEFSIPLIVKVRQMWGFTASQWLEAVIRYGTLIVLLSAVLYPYLYICLRVAFSRQQAVYFEVGRSLGKRPSSIFWRVALPIARPVLIAGLSLIIMEVVNDYGAVNFFGVPTLTEGIFRTWFDLGDRASGLRLSVVVLFLVFAVLAFEAWQRRRLRYTEGAQSTRAHSRVRLNGWMSSVAWICCAVPLIVGFLFPVGRLIYWAWLATDGFEFGRFFGQVLNSLWLAGLTSVVLSFMAFFLAFVLHTHKGSRLGKLVHASTLGYAIPSVVTGVGVMVFFSGVDRFLGSSFEKLTLSGTLTAIFFAYVVRFMTVAYQPIKGGLQSVCPSLHEASLSLNQPRWRSLLRVHGPLLKMNLLACAILVFIDITKELPLTLVLRPSNFETLATFAFGFAKEGAIYDCAMPSLMIVALGVWGLLVVERWIVKEVS